MSEFSMWDTAGKYGDSVHHRSADGDHMLMVSNAHRKNRTGPERSVTMKAGDQYTTLIVRPQNNETIVSATGGTPTAVPMASEQLQSLIEHHRKSPEWMPLLDKLVEEYPDHFTDAVSAHTAARQSNAAEHYARAFTATQRQ